MSPSHLTRRLARSVCALAASACVLLAIAAAATARPADNGPPSAARPNPAPTVIKPPTVVKQTVLRPDDGGPDAIALVLIGIGGAAALLGAGYLGGRIAIRTRS